MGCELVNSLIRAHSRLHFDDFILMPHLKECHLKKAKTVNKFTDFMIFYIIIIFNALLGEFLYNCRSCQPHRGIREMRKQCKNIVNIY